MSYWVVKAQLEPIKWSARWIYNRVRSEEDRRKACLHISPFLKIEQNLNPKSLDDNNDYHKLCGKVRHYGSMADTMAAEKYIEECGGVFDLKLSTFGLSVTDCKKRSQCPLLVFLYASLGLHRYNFLKGTRFEVSRVNKFVKTTHAAASSFYITLLAKEPAAPAGGSSSSPPQTTFEIHVSEESFGKFVLGCSIARIRGETRDDIETTSVYIPGKSYIIGKHLPEWPSENPFEKYCLVNELEMQDKDKDWIHLYLELAVATSDWLDRKEPTDYDCLEIVDNVAIYGEGLNAKNATFYIRYKDLFRARLDMADVDRVAIVRRRFDEESGDFSLEGQILSSENIKFS